MNVQDLKIKCTELGIKTTSSDTLKTLQKKIKNKIMSNETKAGIISKEQIESWKKEHKKVHILRVKVAEGDVAIGYLKNPSRNHKATALSMYSQNKVLECGEFLRDNCWLGGDERLKTDSDIADSAAISASGIVKFLETELGEA